MPIILVYIFWKLESVPTKMGAPAVSCGMFVLGGHKLLSLCIVELVHFLWIASTMCVAFLIDYFSLWMVLRTTT
jgi:hypothetical protein